MSSFSLTSLDCRSKLLLRIFVFRLQYNISIKQFLVPSVSKLYVAYDFSIYRRNNRGRYKCLVTDNYYSLKILFGKTTGLSTSLTPTVAIPKKKLSITILSRVASETFPTNRE